MKNEKLQPNKAEATLFVGLGGIGSRIIKGVRERCVFDDLENVQFVTMDTDVNDLERLEKGPAILSIQTSSSRSVAAYLRNDKVAKNEWFPENKILDGKTVSEGAGQVRAISRLALNATIKQGKIATLYKAIDKLYLKNGTNKNRAVKVVIASTATGGTGSGITLPLAMLIRQYLKKNYPESAAIIRGFIVMPSVMDTVIDSESERKSQRRNGYATIKEINAFMMKASGAFDYDSRLRRYSDLHITVPTTSSSDDQLSNLPFDFCFLFERTDSNQRNMEALKQYEDYAAQCIYEQNIGPMKASANSKEDNIIKEFSNPDKHGRCRFGGTGASVIKYSYDDIRDYIALDWAQNSILGVPSAKGLSEEEKDKALYNSWMIYDRKFKDAVDKYNEDPNTSSEPPKRASSYISDVETSDDQFTKMLKKNFFELKIKQLKNPVEDGSDHIDRFKTSMNLVEEEYFADLFEYVANFVGAQFIYDPSKEIPQTFADKMGEFAEGINPSARFYTSTYSEIEKLSGFINKTEEIKELTRKCINAVFDSEEGINGENKAHKLASYLSAGKKAMHPNAARYMIYKLLALLNKAADTSKPLDRNDYFQEINGVIASESKMKKKEYAVNFNGKSEDSLSAMCQSCDALEGVIEGVNAEAKTNCKKHLNSYFDVVKSSYERQIKAIIVKVAIERLEQIAKTYEDFYDTFAGKVFGIEKAREEIVDKLSFNTGDCVYNLFGSEAALNTLSKRANPAKAEGGEDSLYTSIYSAICENTAIKERIANDAFSTEVTIDIFDDVVLKTYKESTERICDPVIDKDILQAIKLEYEIDCDMKIASTELEEEKNKYKKLKNDKDQVLNYINKMIVRGKNLASPSISKNDFEEEREVSAIAYSTHLKDFSGIEVSKLLDPKNASDSVSRYELHFFRSIYGLTPIQLAKLCSPAMPREELDKCVDIGSISGNVEIGDYFVSYQEYMESIGPDCKLNALITPHIDKCWNSISVMPELDLDYQRHLMQDIHQAFFYGFLFDIIQKYSPTVYDPLTTVYRYYDKAGEPKVFTVSNGTLCDKFDEVLDSLYFDRAAVKDIKSIAFATREADIQRRVAFADSKFNLALANLSRVKMLGEIVGEDQELISNTPTSIFEIPIIYYNSMMVSNDIDEIRAMTEAIINAVEYQISATEKKSDVKPHLARILVEHTNLLLENYSKFNKFLAMGVDIGSNDAMVAVYKCVQSVVNKYLPNGNDLYSLNHFNAKK